MTGSPGGAILWSMNLTVLALAVLPVLATAQPSLTVSPKASPPGTKVALTGAGFDPKEVVKFSFDATDVRQAVTNSAGGFSQVELRIPASATPGRHKITAAGKRSGVTVRAHLQVRTNWVQFGFNAAHSNFNPHENVLDASNVAGLTVLWKAPTGATFSSATLADGVVYVTSAGIDLYAFDAQTGAQLWEVAPGGTESPIMYSTPAVANGVVYVGSEDDNVYALNAETGAALWKAATTGSITSSPVVDHGTVYVGSRGKSVYAFNAATGEQLWQTNVGGGVVASPAVAGGVVYAGAVDENLHALNASTGVQLWAAPMGNDSQSSPSVANGVVYVGTSGGVLAFNATGTQLWAVSTGNNAYTAVAGGVVYVASGDDLFALDGTTGAQLWEVNTNNIVDAAPAVANGVVYSGTGNDVYAFDASTGATLWNAVTGNSVPGTPAVANGMVFAPSGDHNLYAFSLPVAAPRRVTPAAQQRPMR